MKAFQYNDHTIKYIRTITGWATVIVITGITIMLLVKVDPFSSAPLLARQKYYFTGLTSDNKGYIFKVNELLSSYTNDSLSDNNALNDFT